MGDKDPIMWSNPPAYQQQQGQWQPQQLAPPPQQGAMSAGGVLLTVGIWVAWFAVSVVADFLGFLMFAFADAPGAGRAAQAMIVPAFAWFGFTFIAGVILLIRQRWWRIVMAFALAVSPPFVIFAGYNLLDGGGRGSSGSRSPGPAGSAPTPAPMIRTPPGGFVPAPMKLPEQPDFRKTIEQYSKTRPWSAAPPTTTQPAAATQP